MSPCRSILLVTSRLLTTVARILSTSPEGAISPIFSKPLDGVLFGLPLPHAFGDDRRGIGPDVTLVVHRLWRVDQDLGELLVLAQTLAGRNPRGASAL